jgi:hypothetical protein
MLGDTPSDIASAIKTGVTVVFLCCGGWVNKDLAVAMGNYDSSEDPLAHDESWAFAR